MLRINDLVGWLSIAGMKIDYPVMQNKDDEYYLHQADTQEDFDSFYNNIKELSLYDTGVEARFGDTFLTLSTCAYHVKDGRFVVVAKRVA